jgi:hypothetical protein
MILEVRRASRRLVRLQQYESPGHRDEFTLAGVCLAHDRSRIGGKD